MTKNSHNIDLTKHSDNEQSATMREADGDGGLYAPLCTAGNGHPWAGQAIISFT
jgi:hypothetical protein